MTQRKGNHNGEEEEEGIHSSSFWHLYSNRDIWKDHIMSLLLPLEVIALTLICRKIRDDLKTIINSELHALFIVYCNPCGSRSALHRCEDAFFSVCEHKREDRPVIILPDSPTAAITCEIGRLKMIDFHKYAQNYPNTIAFSLHKPIMEGWFGTGDSPISLYSINPLRRVSYSKVSSEDYVSFMKTHFNESANIISITLFWQKAYPSIKEKNELFHSIVKKSM